MSTHDKQLNGYRMLKKLGSGATGDVYMTTKDNKNYALKVYKQNDENNMRCLQNERQYGAQIQDERVITPIEVFKVNSSACVAYELAEGGELYDYVANSSLPLNVAKYYALELINAVKSMHQAGVCHRDLKLENIVLNAQFNLKLIDLGMACPITGQKGSGFEAKVFCGTKGYRAPEIAM